QYVDLGSCTATIGSNNVRVTFSHAGLGTNTPGGILPDLSAILIQPNFFNLSIGFEQDLIVLLAPGSWHPLPGQDLFLEIAFNETLTQPLVAMEHIVSTSTPGQIESQVCLGGFGGFFASCSGEVHTTTTSGNIAIVTVSGLSAVTSFGVLGTFAGTP